MSLRTNSCNIAAVDVAVGDAAPAAAVASDADADAASKQTAADSKTK